ncbi:MAG TPA: hypothetical protein V6C85_30225 [Allocoleopsis sp.]
MTVAQPLNHYGSENLPNTIISIQYSDNDFLSFRVHNVSRGQIVYNGTKPIGLRCQINRRFYTLNDRHFQQMSDRECRDLFDYLKLDGSQLLQA